MADNPSVRAGTAGGTIVVVGDEITVYGSTGIAQGVKLHTGVQDGTVAATVNAAGELHVYQPNAGTVSVTGTPNVHVTNSGTVTLTGTNPTFQTNSGTVIQGTDPWLTHQTNNGTVSVTGTPNVHVTNAATVNGGTLLGQRGTITALQGTDPWLVSAWLNSAGTVSVSGTPNVHVTNAATVNQGGAPWTVTANGGTLLGQMGTVNVAGTPNVHVTNAATVTANGGTLLGQAGTVTALQGTDPWVISGTVTATGSGGANQADRSAFADGSGQINPIGGVLNDTPTDPTEDQAAAVRVTAKRALHVNLRDDAGAEVSVGGGTQYDEDTAHVSGDKITLAGAVQSYGGTAFSNADGDRTVLAVDNLGALWAHVNDGTIAVKGNVIVGNNGTVSITGTPNVFVTNAATVNQGGAPWTVTANGGTLLGALGTVSVTGTPNVHITNAATVGALPGGITGFAEDAGHTTGDVGIQSLAVRKNVAAALAGADADYTPLISDDVGAAWVHANDGTVAIKGNVLVGNNGTVSITGTPNIHVTNAATVTLTGTNPTFQTNSGTVIQGTNPWLVTAWVNSAGTVSVTGTPNVHVTNAATVTATDLDIRNLAITQDSITKGSATIGLGYTLGGTNILLTASGTVVPSVSSRTLYVTHEALTVQGGTVTITARNGDGGGTLWGPMQFSPTGGIAASLPIEDGGLFETASGSAVYYELAGSGTVGGRIRWARLAS